MAAAGRASAVGIELAVSFLGCFLLGYWLDGKLGTSPALTLVGLVLGAFAGFWALYKTVKQTEARMAAAEEAERRERQRRGGGS